MYAIAFDLNTAELTTHYPGATYQNAHAEIKNFLVDKGFTRRQASVYFGDTALVDAVTCVMAVNALSQKFPWFKVCVTDIRILRIEENNDLSPAL